MKRILLIDGDIFVHQVSHLAEVPIKWNETLWTLHSDENEAKANLDRRIDEIVDTLKADAFMIALNNYDDPFRKRIYPLYKSNRKDSRKPLVFHALREYLHTTYGPNVVFERPGLEGDDCLGILATRPVKEPCERIIVSIDKDMKSIPGKYYNQNHPENGIVEVSELEADTFHMIQTLTGDVTDGYPGCPGIGPVKAARLLDGVHPDLYWQVVVTAYEAAGLTEHDALIQARVARILRACDYDFKKKEPKLWNPPCTRK